MGRRIWQGARINNTKTENRLATKQRFTSELMNISDYFEQPDGIYALSHSVGPMTIASKLALNEHYIRPWSTLGGDAWPQWLGQIDNFCTNIGQVINASADEICPQINLASGFYSFITAIAKLPECAHKNTILMHQDAFASMGFVVKGMAKTFNLKLVLIKGAANNTDNWQQAFDSNEVLACLVTHVHSNTSVKSDVAAICAIAKQCKAYACVDIAQSVGIVPVDVKKWRADAVFGSCVKWLCGGPGAGFMYIKNDLIEVLAPDPIGWFSHQNPFEFDINQYTPAISAKRFWGGTPSIAPYVTANASISTLLGIGLVKLHDHNLALKSHLVNNLCGHKVFDDLKNNYRSVGGSLCIPSPKEAIARQQLLSNGVKFDERNGIFRISMHAVNTIDEACIIAECFT